MYYLPSIAASVGFNTNAALGETGINGIVNFCSTFLAFVFVDKFGRRPLLMYGALIMGLAMAVLGVTGAVFIPIDLIGRPVVASPIAGWVCIVSVYIFVFA